MHETGWIDIMRTGTFTAMDGQKATFTAEDLDGIAGGFDESKRRVPLVFGHPKTEDPAFGWVAELRRAGEVLQAKFKQVHETVKELVSAGHYKNVSVSLFPDRTLRHVGLLGATQPAIPGLKEVALESGEEFRTFEFSAVPDSERVQRLQAELETHKSLVQQALAELSRLREEKASLDQNFASAENTYRRKAREARFDQLMRDAKALPYERERVLFLAEALSGSGGTFEFAEGGKTIPAEDVLWSFLEKRTAHGLFTEFATKERYAEGARPDTQPGDFSRKA